MRAMSGKGKGWWGRNWKWCVPVGCLGIIGCVVALFAVCVGIGYMMLKSSAPYQAAIAAAKSDPRVIAALGAPVTPGLLFTGKVNESTDWSSTGGESSSGWADMHIQIHGPKGKGKIHVGGSKVNGKWIYHTLTVEIEATHETIDLNKRPKKSEFRRSHQKGPELAMCRVTANSAV